MIDAMLQLGQEQGIPIGIEYTDAAAFRSCISLREQNTSVEQLLDAITHPQGYSWLQAASLRLLGQLNFAQHPQSTGIVGDYPSGNPQLRVGPWTMRNATVRQILNASFHSTTTARGSSSKLHGTWTRSHPMGCGECSTTMETRVRNIAVCFRYGDWAYTILSDPRTRYCYKRKRPRLIESRDASLSTTSSPTLPTSFREIP
jgi:hypothetical protein